MADLTIQQNMFVIEYLKDNNGKQAAIRAGYSIKTAEVAASRLLSQAKVREVIDKQLKAREARSLITVDFILNGIVNIAKYAERDSDRLRAYELLGKNQKLFVDKTEITGDKDSPVHIKVNLIDD